MLYIYPMRYQFGKKFAEKDIDTFINAVYKNFKENPKDKYLFDLTKIEWISNQELLVFTGLLKYFIERKIDFQVEFFKKGIPYTEIDKRVAKQLIQIWDVWQIWRLLPNLDFTRYFGIEGNDIDRLKRLYSVNSSDLEIYKRYGITPFISLAYIKNYKDNEIEEILKPFYRLNAATKEIVYNHNCEHPFVTNVLSSILSKELYENFLDHFFPSFFNTENNWAFMSLSLKAPIIEEEKSFDYLQNLLKINFEEEQFEEFRNFFYDGKIKEFKNQPYLQFSFLDFGVGIIETLKPQYLLELKKDNSLFVNESDILKFAFKHYSSRHPILDQYGKDDVYIPRGLFDIIGIVMEYGGLLVVRSNYGKIMYDFSNVKDIERAFSPIGNDTLFFPGTLISIYLPAVTIDKKIDTSSIKPIIKENKYRVNSKKYINLYNITNRIKSQKKDLLFSILNEIKTELKSSQTPQTFYFSFRRYNNDKRLAKKIIFFLMSDYEINLNNNVIIVFPPDKETINDIERIILNLSNVIKNYKLHPLPLIYYDLEHDDLTLKWLGVYSENDKIKLNNLLFEESSIAESDLEDPYNVIGHLNYFDNQGNLRTHLPNRRLLVDYYKKDYLIADNNEIEKLIIKHECIKPVSEKIIYLCNANYYQYQYVDLTNILYSETDCNLMTEILFWRIIEKGLDIKKHTFIGITSSSHKILYSLIGQGHILKEQVVFLDNYHSFYKDDGFNKIPKHAKCILICNVIATGQMVNQLTSSLTEKKAVLSLVAVIVNTIDENFENSNEFVESNKEKFISLYKFKIEKYRREHAKIRNDLKEKEVIRINPFTSIPITLSIEDVDKNNVLLTCQEFLDSIQEDDIKVGYLKFNYLIHPYFFDTNKILENFSPDLLKKFFDKISFISNEIGIFFPKDSGVKNLDFTFLKNEILKNHSVEIYELDRFITYEGWKFPHTTEYFSNLIDGKSILILDDGSCTGDSLIQMIDEITFAKVKEIVLICFIGRINDHKREFFAKLSSIKTKATKPVKIDIYFASQWHIPTYYLDDNPNSKECSWLKDVKNLQNTPESIRRLSRTILKEIEPKIFEKLKDYKFLPKLKATEKQVSKKDLLIPKKEMLIVRDEIGKVIGYRFYKESFDYFNRLIRKYESDVKEARNKDIEILCATFLYESYLFDKISLIMPDVVDKIEEFIDALIFGNPKKGNKKIDINVDLTYQWDKIDILHLFFIVFKNKKLAYKLNDIEKLKALFNFIKEIEFAINYILYKLLVYFPLNKNELNEKNGGQFLHLLDIVLQENFLTPQFSKDIKIFRSFVATLPSNKDYYSVLAIINENYRKLTDAYLHKQSILVNYDIMLVDLEVMKSNFDKLNKDNFLEGWTQLIIFIEAILSFSSSFPTFFLNKLPIVEGDSEFSLRTIHGKLNELINNLNKYSDFEAIKFLITKFGDKFLHSESEMFKIFSKISTGNFKKILLSFFEDRDILPSEIEFNFDLNEDFSVDFPFFFLSEIIFREVIINLRHRDKNHKVELLLTNSEKSIKLEIKNVISKHISPGGGNGLTMLERINNFPNGIIKYSNNNKSKTDIFHQEFKIKKA